MRPDGDAIMGYAENFLGFAEDLTIPAASGRARFGDVMADFQREEFRLLAPSLDAVAHGRVPPISRFWWERTKGASKDSDLAVAILWLLAFSPETLYGQVAAADQDQADELRLAAQAILRLNPWLARVIEIKGDRIVRLREAGRALKRQERSLVKATESICEIIPADIPGSHGARPDFLVSNELSHVTKQEFVENLWDNLSKMPRGLGIIATNAGSLRTWQWKWRQLAEESERWHFHKWDDPAPWIDPAELEEARIRNSPRRFDRLFRGIWTAPGGDGFEAEWIRRAVKHEQQMWEATATYGHAGGIGVDLGLVGHHAAVVAVLASFNLQTIRVAEVRDFPPPVSISAVEDVIREMGQRFNVRLVAADPWQSAGMCQRLESDGFRTTLEYPQQGTLSRQANVLMELLRCEQLELYSGEDGQLLVDDLYATRVIDKQIADVLRAFRLEWPQDERGHCDRAAAMCNVLPYVHEALGAEPLEHVPDGLPYYQGGGVCYGADLGRLLEREEWAQQRWDSLDATAGMSWQP